MACLDEPTLVAFVGGRLGAAQSDSVDHHLAECRSCRDLVVVAARTTFAGGSRNRTTVRATPRDRADPITPTTGLDRYTITGLIGAGGQALVYTADDTVLGRTIALKILRDPRGDSILEEARLVAKLSHPNIVAIHDAGATADGQLYLAMEYVAGGSLDRWLRMPKPAREVLRVCIEAGRGLAAAHAAEIVHRDIKAANILIGDDGRARVTDFGLATVGAAAPRIAGTLAYMAPEQLDGHATAASDQFSLAVTIWEALTGTLPFAMVGDRAAAVLAGPSSPRRMPRHVASTLRRALQPDPAARWPSIDAFLAALAKDLARPRRRAAGGLVTLGTVAIVVSAFANRTPSETCAHLDTQLRQTWDAAAKSKIERAFGRSHKPFAAASYAAIVRELDAYAGDWIAVSTSACKATAVTHNQSSDMLDRRNQCLDERRAALAATINALASADDGVIDHAMDLTHGMPSLAPCSDLAWLAERVRAPTGDADRARVAAVTAQIAKSTAQLRAGKIREAAATAGGAVDAAANIEHAPTNARAQLALGKAQALLGDSLAAEKSLEAAAQLAQRGRDDRAAAEAWIELVKIIGHGNARYAEALRYAGFAEATAARLGNDRELRGRLDYYRCAVFDLMAHLDEAEAACANARKEREAAFGADAPEIADVLVLEARLAVKRNRFADARAYAARAIQIREVAYGKDHPSLTEALFAEGQVALNDGRLDDADASYGRAIAVARGAYGEDTIVIAAILSEQADLAHQRGKLPEALALIDRSTAIRERVEGADHPDVVFGLIERGRILDDQGKLAEAVTALERALAIAEAKLGDAHPTVSAILQDLGRLHGKLADPKRARAELDRAIAVATKSGDQGSVAAATTALAEFLHLGGAPREALPVYARALATYEALVGAEHPKLIATLTNIGLAEIDVGNAKAAIPYLERAIRIEGKRSGETSPQLLNPLTALGDAQLAIGNRAAARASWERGLALTEVAKLLPEDVRDLRAKLAKLR